MNHGKDRKGFKLHMNRNFPNILTVSRIVAIPIIVLSFYFSNPIGRWVAAICFILACITDFLDGYLARLWSQTSRFGQVFDPIADKLLVSSTLLLAAGFGRISSYSLIPALIILCREILVSGLREFLSDMRIALPVSNVAKWKTVIQMMALSLLLLGDTPSSPRAFLALGEGCLWLAALLTLYTGYQYWVATFRNLD